MTDEIAEKIMEDVRDRFESALSDTFLELSESERYKKARAAFMSDLWDEIEYGIVDRMSEQMRWLVDNSVDRAVEAIIEGDPDGLRQALALNGRGGEPSSEMMAGKLREDYWSAKRRRIVEAHTDLLISARVRDLEQQVNVLIRALNRQEELQSAYEYAQGERDTWRQHCLTLLANLDRITEVTGEAPEDEDVVIVARIRASLEGEK